MLWMSTNQLVLVNTYLRADINSHSLTSRPLFSRLKLISQKMQNDSKKLKIAEPSIFKTFL